MTPRERAEARERIETLVRRELASERSLAGLTALALEPHRATTRREENERLAEHVAASIRVLENAIAVLADGNDAGEAERIAAAMEARDVALVEAARDASDGAHVVARVLGIDWGTARYLVCNAMGTPDDVTAAIRAARKVKP